MTCLGLCGGVPTAQKQMTVQVPIRFYVFVIGICLGLGLVLGQCECTISPQLLKRLHLP